MLTTETFAKGMAILESCYKTTLNLSEEDKTAWYAIIKTVIGEKEFPRLVVAYCQSESSLTCPANLINYWKKLLAAGLPEPAVFAESLYSKFSNMLFDRDFKYEERTKAERQNYLVSKVLPSNISENIPHYQSIVTIVGEYLDLLMDAFTYQDPTKTSVLLSDIKSSYKKALDNSQLYVVNIASLLENNNSLLLINGGN